MSWVAIVPVKGSAGAEEAKTRLGDHPDRARLADAFALDTVSALLAASSIARVCVVTADELIAARMLQLGAVVIPEDSGRAARQRAGDALPDPLNWAIVQGVAAAHEAWPALNVAVVTGDLPALRVADIETALALAADHERSMIPDREGAGTTTLLALAGVEVTPRFGRGSRAAHEAAGHIPLDIPSAASIRRDVDTVDNLADALHLGVGAHTSALVASTAPALAPAAGSAHPPSTQALKPPRNNHPPATSCGL